MRRSLPKRALGPPIAYTTTSDVVLQRPDRLRVITLGDGPPSEFCYDAFAPVAARNCVP